MRRIIVVAAAGSVVALALAVGGSVPEVSGDSATQGPCNGLPQEVNQSPTGAISGCMRVGALGSGRYTISLQTNLEDDQAVVKKLSPGVGATRRPDGPPVKLSLSPDAGPPGTAVTVTGRVSRPISVSGRLSFAKGLGDFTWDGSPQGLMLRGTQIRWRSAESFTAKVSVPAAPWVEGGNPPQVLGWRSGRYPLSVHCVTSPGGCAVAVPEGSAEFKLEVEHPPKWCSAADSCATLTATPNNESPNSVVRISGYAPLVGFDFGEGQFLGSIQITPGREHNAVRFTPRRAPTLATFGAAPFAVRASPHFASLGRVRSLFEVTDGSTPIAADPTNARIVAWCGGDRGITLSVDGARVTVPTGTVAAPLHADAVYPPIGGTYRCVDVLPLSRLNVLAAFPGETGAQTGIYANYAAETRDGGRTWTALPAPPGSIPAGFGGFRSSGRAALAVFARRVKSRNGPPLDATSPVAETSHDGGSSWTPTHLPCSTGGPCVTLGPFLPGDCAMGISTQYVVRSTNGGHSWRRAPILDPFKLACGDAQLVTTGQESELLVDALSGYPIQRTIDGGATWQNASLTPPNHLEVADEAQGLGDFGPGGITLLPDGALLLTGGGPYAGGWQLLRSGARRWCDVAGYTRTWQLASQASSVTVIGRDLWWLTYGSARANPRTPLHLRKRPLSAVRCS